MALENCYNWELEKLEKEKMAKSKSGKQPGSKTLTGIGCSQTLKLHLKKATQGLGWSHVEPKDLGLDVGKKYEPPQNELLPLGENVTDVLDYDKDLEVAQAVANIPSWLDDVEMQDMSAPPGFEPEVSCTGYHHNLVQASENPGLGPNSPVTKREDRMLDEDPQAKAPGNGRLGLDGNTSCPITKK